MVYFYTKNPNLGIFWRALEWKRLVYFMTIQNIFSRLVYFIAIWYGLWSISIFFPVFGIFGPRKNLATLLRSRQEGGLGV
jgi:hypothetical protein